MDLDCTQRMSSDLDGELAALSVRALAELERTIRTVVESSDGDFTDSKERSLWEWGVSLATLTHDVGSSAHILATHQSARAAMILNRCLSEYWVRLEFYMGDPVAAVADLTGFETQMRKVFQARPLGDIADKISPEQMRILTELVGEPSAKPTRRQVRTMFEDVYAAKADVLYDIHYAIASAYVHGSALATADVIRKSESTDPNDFTFHFATNVFSLNTILGETVIHVIAMLRTAGRLFAQPNETATYAGELDLILERLKLI